MSADQIIGTSSVSILDSYLDAKLALADILRRLAQCLERRGERGKSEAANALSAKLAEDQLTVAALGQFKRGKSTLLNAMLGHDLLPSGILPVTSAITLLRYGPVERLSISRKGLSFAEDAAVDRLAEYVSETHNPGNVKQVTVANLEVPSPMLRQGAVFADTPGIGAAGDVSTKTTLGFLPSCDAALFISSAETPLSAIEVEFLAMLRQYVTKVFFVLNKVDMVSRDDRDAVSAYFAEHIRSVCPQAERTILPVSAAQGLKARETGDMQLLEQSGLPDLEQVLTDFLTSEKTASLLVSVAAKALQLSGYQVDIGAALISSPAADVLRLLMDELKKRIDGGCPHITPVDGGNAAADGVPSRAAPLTGSAGGELRSGSHLEIELPQTGCPACDHAANAVFSYLAHAQYQLSVNDSDRMAFAAQRGYCKRHLWHVQRLSSTHGAAIAYQPLAIRLAEELDESVAGEDAGDRIAGLFMSEDDCPVCRVIRSAEASFLTSFARLLADDAFRKRYAATAGLCLPHIEALLRMAPANGIVSFVIADAARKFRELARDMGLYAVKRDGTRRGLVRDHEEEAAYQLVLHVAGKPYLLG